MESYKVSLVVEKDEDGYFARSAELQVASLSHMIMRRSEHNGCDKLLVEDYGGDADGIIRAPWES